MSGPPGVAGVARGRSRALLAAWLLGGLALALIVASVVLTVITGNLSASSDGAVLALAFVFVVYNFVTVHSTLKTTPAVAHGLTDRPWTMEELLGELVKYA